jgi:hypothetical protein
MALFSFEYLGMRFGGMVHANCHDGYVPGAHDPDALKMADLVRDAVRPCRRAAVVRA